MPDRWQACFEGRGEIDLTSVRCLSETQIMWPAGSILSALAVLAAAKLVNAASEILEKDAYPEALKNKKGFKGPVCMLPEKVLDVRSLVLALGRNLEGRMLSGEVTDVTPDGEVVVSGHALRAQRVIFAAGTGNELALSLLKIAEHLTQRRPLRQVMVRSLPYAFFGHGIAGDAKPRVTITSHPTGEGGYVWYLGGGIAETGADMDEAAALRFARKEMEKIFPEIDWDDKEWATWLGDRAEPLDSQRRASVRSVRAPARPRPDRLAHQAHVCAGAFGPRFRTARRRQARGQSRAAAAADCRHRLLSVGSRSMDGKAPDFRHAHSLRKGL